MTINIALKCPQGIVMGADSLVTLYGADRSKPAALVPRYRKLFQLGDLPAGAMLNGDVVLSSGRRVDDVATEVAEAVDASRPYELSALAKAIRDEVNANSSAAMPNLELIICGFSKGERIRRSGEMYTITWEDDHEGDIADPYPGDGDYGYVSGGMPDAIDRFLGGLDLPTARQIIDEADDRFAEVRDYIVRELESLGVAVPDALKGMLGPLPTDLPPWRAVSSFRLDPGAVTGELDMVRAIVRSARNARNPLFGHFSLPMAADFAWHLLMMAWAESNFMPGLPVVGSHLMLATITRKDGYREVHVSEPGVALAL